MAANLKFENTLSEDSETLFDVGHCFHQDLYTSYCSRWIETDYTDKYGMDTLLRDAKSTSTRRKTLHNTSTASEVTT